MSDHEQAALGRRAFDELEVLNGVFDKLEQKAIEKLKQTPIGADAMVQKLHMTLHNLTGIRTAMREMVENGRYAEVAIAMAELNKP